MHLQAREDSTEPLEPSLKAAVEVVHVLNVKGTSYPLTGARQQSLMLAPQILRRTQVCPVAIRAEDAVGRENVR